MMHAINCQQDLVQRPVYLVQRPVSIHMNCLEEKVDQSGMQNIMTNHSVEEL
jgi:hypothetical protein